MGEATMVMRDITEGARLIGYLDASKSPLTTAILVHDIALDLWRLVLAVPRSTTQSRMALYETVQKAIAEMDLSFSLSRITRVYDTEPLIGTIRAYAEASLSDVVEVPLGGVDFAGSAVDRGYAYHIDAIRYEEDIFAALQRIQPQGAVLRRSSRLSFADSFNFDFVIDNGSRAVIIEAKSLRHPLAVKDVQRIAVADDETIRYYANAILVIAAKRGFSQTAREWVASDTVVRQAHWRAILLVKWADSDDDPKLSTALVSALQ